MGQYTRSRSTLDTSAAVYKGGDLSLRRRPSIIHPETNITSLTPKPYTLIPKPKP